MSVPERFVTEAMGVRCPACKAKPGEECHSVIDGKALPGRPVHWCRAEFAA